MLGHRRPFTWLLREILSKQINVSELNTCVHGHE